MLPFQGLVQEAPLVPVGIADRNVAKAPTELELVSTNARSRARAGKSLIQKEERDVLLPLIDTESGHLLTFAVRQNLIEVKAKGLIPKSRPT
jgi:hypothetical protein